MNDQSPQKFQQYPQPPSFQSTNDEIDLKELFMALWIGKVWVIGLALLFTAGATMFALKQPNIYESKAILAVDADPYSIDLNIGPEANAAFNIIAGKEVKKQIEIITNVASFEPHKLLINKERKGRSITVSQQGKSSDLIFKNVHLFTKNINEVLVQLELEKAELALLSLKELIKTNDSIVVKDVLAKKYAQQLYKIALLKSPNTELIRVIQEPIKATGHIKPKRALIIILGTLFGCMLGVAIILVRFAFSKEK